MLLSELWQQVLVAFLGGFAAEMLHWYVLGRTGKPVPQFARRPLYWVTTLCMIVLGAFTPVLYISGAANALLCFHLGASTPLLLAKLLSQLPDVAQGQGPGLQNDAGFRDFISW